MKQSRTQMQQLKKHLKFHFFPFFFSLAPRRVLILIQVGVAIKKQGESLANHAKGAYGIARRASGWNPQLACGMESPQSGAWNPP